MSGKLTGLVGLPILPITAARNATGEDARFVRHAPRATILATQQGDTETMNAQHRRVKIFTCVPPIPGTLWIDVSRSSEVATEARGDERLRATGPGPGSVSDATVPASVLEHNGQKP